ncbi:hypothetical protein [Telluribacter sp.]|jgi:hypothetical protein|uniref:hypothetical protein n=1 Tax=Telluribacter sp. TaxID=1978767 RepID=UPI002E0D42E2|nr:hypothetical protein [Telluribacter sp.]
MNYFQGCDVVANVGEEKPWSLSLVENECCALKKCCKNYKKKGKYCKKCPKKDD